MLTALKFNITWPDARIYSKNQNYQALMNWGATHESLEVDPETTKETEPMCSTLL